MAKSIKGSQKQLIRKRNMQNVCLSGWKVVW